MESFYETEQGKELRKYLGKMGDIAVQIEMQACGRGVYLSNAEVRSVVESINTTCGAAARSAERVWELRRDLDSEREKHKISDLASGFVLEAIAENLAKREARIDELEREIEKLRASDEPEAPTKKKHGVIRVTVTEQGTSVAEELMDGGEWRTMSSGELEAIKRDAVFASAACVVGPVSTTHDPVNVESFRVPLDSVPGTPKGSPPAPQDGARTMGETLQQELNDRADEMHAAAFSMDHSEGSHGADCQAASIALRKAADALDAKDAEMGNLLAVLHGDGGHHQQEVGTKQAIEDAINKHHDLQADLAEARGGLDRLPRTADGVRVGPGSLVYVDLNDTPRWSIFGIGTLTIEGWDTRSEAAVFRNTPVGNKPGEIEEIFFAIEDCYSTPEAAQAAASGGGA